MADTVERILLSLELNADALQQGLARTTSEAEKLRGEQTQLQAKLKELQATGQAGGATWNEYKVKLQQTTTALDAVKKEQAQFQLQATKLAQANNAEAGSLNQKRSALSAANAQYARASAEMKKADSATIALGKDIGVLTEELKAEEAALGMTFRNVGNYPKTVMGLNGVLKELQTELRNVGKNSEEFKKITAEIKEVKSAIETTGGTITGMKQYLADLQAELKNVKVGSTEFKKLSHEIAEVKTELQVATGKYDEFGNRKKPNAVQQHLKETKQLVTGVVAGMELLSLANSDHEEAEKAVAKATKATAIILATEHAIMGAGTAINLISLGVKKAKIAITEAEIVQTRGLTIATVAQAAAQAVLNAVMNANPVLLIVAGVAALAGALAWLFKSSHEQEEQEKKMAVAYGKTAEAMEKTLDKTKAMQADRLSLMEAEGKSELDRNKQKIADADANFAQRAKIEKQYASQAAIFRKQLAEAEDQEDKDKINEKIKTNTEAMDKLLEEDRHYHVERKILAIETNKIIEEDAKRSLDLRINAMRNGHAKDLAMLKQERDEKLKDAKTDEDRVNIEKAYQNSVSDLRTQWYKESRDKQRAALEDSNNLAVSITKEGTLARYNAEKAGIEKMRDFELKEAGISETKKALIRSEAQNKLNELANARLQKEKDIARQEVELRASTEKALDDVANNVAVTPEQKLAAKLNSIHEASVAELTAAQDKARELKQLAETEIEDENERAKRIAEIDENLSAKQLAIMTKSHADIVKENNAFKQQQYQQQISDAQDELSLMADDWNLQLDKKQEILTLQYEKEKKAAEDAGKATTLITAKYEKAKQKLIDETANHNLDETKKALTQASALFKQNTVAYKMLASAVAVIDTYQAANKTLAAYAGVPIPGYAIAQVALTIASGIANVIKINSVDAGSHYEGGYTGDGDPRSVSTKLGRKPYTYHKREYVTPAWLVTHPVGRHHVMALEQMRVSSGRSSNLPGFYDGGYVDTGALSRVNAQVSDMYTLENSFSQAVRQMPNPVVYVDDINVGQSTQVKVKSRANL